MTTRKRLRTTTGEARLLDHLGHVRTRIADADGLVVCLDYASAADDRDVISDTVRATLAALADEDDLEVAVVSELALTDLVGRVGVPGLVYAGNHGLEFVRDHPRAVNPSAATYRPVMGELAETLCEALAAVDGCRIDDRDLTVVVDHCEAAREMQPAIRAAVIDAIKARDCDCRTRFEADAIRIGPPMAWERERRQFVGLLERTAAGSDPLLIYLGGPDDEPVFRELGDGSVSASVGPAAETAAEYRLADADELGTFLDWLVDEGVAALPHHHPDEAA